MDFNSLGLLILRVGLGATMAIHHGFPKLLDFTNKMHTFPDPLGIGHVWSLSLTLFAELLCAVALALGLFTRLVALPLVATMGVAFFIVMRLNEFSSKELSLLYLIGFSALFCTGGGRFSVDAIFRKVK